MVSSVRRWSQGGFNGLIEALVQRPTDGHPRDGVQPRLVRIAATLEDRLLHGRVQYCLVQVLRAHLEQHQRRAGRVRGAGHVDDTDLEMRVLRAKLLQRRRDGLPVARRVIWLDLNNCPRALG